MQEKLLQRFRQVGFIEGVSFLVLIFIAMPLKYFFALQVAVKVVGMLHSLLFMAYIYYLIAVRQKYKFDNRFTIFLFIASLIPFGTFYSDTKLKSFDLAMQK